MAGEVSYFRRTLSWRFANMRSHYHVSVLYQAGPHPTWGRTTARATHGLLEEDEGEVDSATSEMMVASSLQLNCGKGAALWFDASFLITTPPPWLGCFTPAALHCIPVWHVDPVAWCPTCRRKGLEDLWKRALHSYDGGVDDTTAQWTVTCTV